MSELRTPLEIEALIAAQSGDIDWAMRAANELMATRTRVQELEARADPDPDQHPAVIAAVDQQQAINYLHFNYPNFDDDFRAEIVAAQTDIRTANPFWTAMQCMQRAIDRVERRRGDPKVRADHQYLTELRAARAKGGLQEYTELHATNASDDYIDPADRTDQENEYYSENSAVIEQMKQRTRGIPAFSGSRSARENGTD